MSQPHYKFLKEKKATIIIAPFNGGQPKTGVELGPEYLLKEGIEDQVKQLDWETTLSYPLKGHEFVNDHSIKIKNCRNVKVVGMANNLIHEAVKSAALNNTLPITLGGDHSIAIGTVSGSFAKYPNAGLIWIDAHADINTPSVTESGNLHGCPVAFLMGLDKENYPDELKWVPEVVKANKLAYIGLRDVDNAEKKILKDLNIAAFSMYHVDKYGINKVVEMAIEAIGGSEVPIHLSYDVDAIDPQFVPATGTPVRGGLTLREGLFIAERIAESGQLIALDVVECNPELAKHESHVLDTIQVGCSITKCALGDTLL